MIGIEIRDKKDLIFKIGMIILGGRELKSEIIILEREIQEM